MTPLEQALKRSTDVSDWLEQALPASGQIDSDYRSAVSLALVSLALEHREAVVLLVQQNARATAMAATRPVLEAYIRACWARELASEADIKAFLRGMNEPKVETIFKRLQKKEAPGRALFSVLRDHYKILNDYAHGGIRQVSRWLHGDGIDPRYSDAQMDEVLRFVDVVGLMAALAREVLLGREGANVFAKLDERLSSPRLT